jgi:hypothetical protein
VVHPDKGVMVLEVKGGGISHDSVSGEWMAIDVQRCTEGWSPTILDFGLNRKQGQETAH